MAASLFARREVVERVWPKFSAFYRAAPSLLGRLSAPHRSGARGEERESGPNTSWQARRSGCAIRRKPTMRFLQGAPSSARMQRRSRSNWTAAPRRRGQRPPYSRYVGRPPRSFLSTHGPDEGDCGDAKQQLTNFAPPPPPLPPPRVPFPSSRCAFFPFPLFCAFSRFPCVRLLSLCIYRPIRPQWRCAPRLSAGPLLFGSAR